MDQIVHLDQRNSLYTDESMRRALMQYAKLRQDLEASHLNQYARIDPDTGDYVIGPTRGAARKSFRQSFGDRVAWTVHIGSA